MQQILRRKQVEEVSGLSRSSLYEAIAKGSFPKPIKIGERSVGWLADEISAWQQRRAALRGVQPNGNRKIR
jgi:prophage regulatory protein